MTATTDGLLASPNMLPAVAHNVKVPESCQETGGPSAASGCQCPAGTVALLPREVHTITRSYSSREHLAAEDGRGDTRWGPSPLLLPFHEPCAPSVTCRDSTSNTNNTSASFAVPRPPTAPLIEPPLTATTEVVDLAVSLGGTTQLPEPMQHSDPLILHTEVHTQPLLSASQPSAQSSKVHHILRRDDVGFCSNVKQGEISLHEGDSLQLGSNAIRRGPLIFGPLIRWITGCFSASASASAFNSAGTTTATTATTLPDLRGTIPPHHTFPAAFSLSAHVQSATAGPKHDSPQEASPLHIMTVPQPPAASDTSSGWKADSDLRPQHVFQHAVEFHKDLDKAPDVCSHQQALSLVADHLSRLSRAVPDPVSCVPQQGSARPCELWSAPVHTCPHLSTPVHTCPILLTN